MEINWIGLLMGILITCISYMLIPVILKINHGNYDEKTAKKIAILNSVIVGFIYMILTIEMSDGNSTWNGAPAVLYFGINYWLLTGGKKDKKNTNEITKNEIKKKSKRKIIIISSFILIMIFIIIVSSSDNTDYNQQRLRARHIYVEDYETASDIISMLNSGDDFCDLVQEYSYDSATVDDCGDVGYFEDGVMVIEFEDAVKNLRYNEYTKLPIRTDYGYHVIMRIK